MNGNRKESVNTTNTWLSTIETLLIFSYAFTFCYAKTSGKQFVVHISYSPHPLVDVE